MTDREKWLRFLEGWRNEVQELFRENAERWNDLALGNPDEFKLVDSSRDDSAREVTESGSLLNEEMACFYSVTNGWPLWLGSLSIKIARVEKLGKFKEKYPSAFENAVQLHREFSTRQLQFYEGLGDCLVLSEPDARDFVLLTKSGGVFLEQFDNHADFGCFFDFMVWAKSRLLRSLREQIFSN